MNEFQSFLLRGPNAECYMKLCNRKFTSNGVEVGDATTIRASSDAWLLLGCHMNILQYQQTQMNKQINICA